MTTIDGNADLSSCQIISLSFLLFRVLRSRTPLRHQLKRYTTALIQNANKNDGLRQVLSQQMQEDEMWVRWAR